MGLNDGWQSVWDNEFSPNGEEPPKPEPKNPLAPQTWAQGIKFPCVHYPPTMEGLLWWIGNPSGGNLINVIGDIWGIKSAILNGGVPAQGIKILDYSPSDVQCFLRIALKFGKDFIPRAGIGYYGRDEYTLLVYNAVMSLWISFGTGALPEYLRQKYGVTQSVAGSVAQSGSDQGTSGSLAIPDSYKKLPQWAITMTQNPFGLFVYNMLSLIDTAWTVLA